MEGNDGVSLLKGSDGSPQVLQSYYGVQSNEQSKFLLLSSQSVSTFSYTGHSYLQLLGISLYYIAF